jgi:CubicO group peptidase (beta-lactamase class C family)
VVGLVAVSVALAFVSDGLPMRPAREVGMSPERLSAIDRVVSRGIKAGGFPGASVVVGRRGFAVVSKGYGQLGWTGDSPSVTADRTIYDLASLTKVVGTGTAAMVLYDEGRLDLDAPVSRYLPAFSGGSKDAVTVRHLLTHHSGLPAGKQLWRMTSSTTEAKRIVLDAPLACAPGRCYIYSDLGADVLGWVVEAIAGQSLDAFLQERVFGPLGMNDTFFRPADSLEYRIAPTEVSPPRGYRLRGEVHDENAFALGGVAGHAGLFSTAADLSIFAQMMLNGGQYAGVRVVSDTTIARFTKRTQGTRALSWETADGEGSSGVYLTERAYGHTGFTGTSMWIDPDREMFVILLTNRVHAARARQPGRVIADVRADLADAASLAVMDGPDEMLAMPAAFRADRAVGWNRPVRAARKSRSSRRSSTKSKKPVTTKTSAKRSASTSKPTAKPSSTSKNRSTKATTTSTAKKSASGR